jgi:2-aminoadipate transaminase
VLPLDRRRHLLEVARRFGTIVLEDNCYYQLFYYEHPPPSLLGLDESGIVLQSGSFSKYLAPGLRMAWIAGPAATVAPLAGVRQDFAVSQLLARALARYLGDGRLESHLELLRDAYRHKHEIAAAALQKHCRPWVRFRVPRGGIYFWLELDDSVDADAALEHAAAGGVRFRPGVRFTGEDDGKRFLRLSCVQIPAPDIEPGIAALGQALAKALKR